MAIFASKINDIILAELRKRELANQNPISDNFNFAGRLPFIILESNAVDTKNGKVSNELAKNNRLYGGSQDFFGDIASGKQKLLIDTELGMRPHAGITSISVNNKGTLGSIREATINFQVWSVDELEKFQVLYMNPGVYLFLQWGYYSLENILPIQSIVSNNPNSIEWIFKSNQIHDLVLKSNGNYDAMAGPCSKFTWKLNRSGGFECSTTIISPASFVYNMGINNSDMKSNTFYLWLSDHVAGVSTSVFNFTANSEEKEGNKFLASMKSKLGEGNTGITNSSTKLFDMEKTKHADVFIEKFFGNGSEYAKYIKFKSNTDIKGKYISFGHLSTLINVCMFAAESEQDIIHGIYNSINNENFGNLTPRATFQTKNICYLDLMTDMGGTVGLVNTICKNHYRLRSFKPNEVIISNKSSEDLYKLSDGSKYGGSELSLSNFQAAVSYETSNKIPHKAVEFTTFVGKELYQPFDGGSSFTYGKISHIFINIESVSRIIKSSPDVVSFIDSILELINSSVSNFFNLVRDNNPENPLSIRIIDSNLVAQKQDVVVFSTYEQNTIIRDISIDANLPSKFQAAAYVGNTNGNVSSENEKLDVSFSNFNNGFKDKGYLKNLEISQKNEEKETNEQRNIRETVEKKKMEDVENVKKNFDEVNKLAIIDPSISTYEKDFFTYLQTKAKETNIDFLGMPIGITLKLNMDGISGIYYGNLFGISYSPKFLQKNVCFQITNVSHDVDSSGWGVSLEGLLRPILNATYQEISITKENEEFKIDLFNLQNIKEYFNKTAIKFDLLEKVLDENDIRSGLRIAHFLSQIAVESGNFEKTVENLNYTSSRLLEKFDKYFFEHGDGKIGTFKDDKGNIRNQLEAAVYGKNGKQKANGPAIANHVYANRMGNGDVESGDGYKFRGRGYIQLTGKNNYTAFGKSLGQDFVTDPDKVATHEFALKSAAWFWTENGLNGIADGGKSRETVMKITKKVNGGDHGLDARNERFNYFYDKLLNKG